ALRAVEPDCLDKLRDFRSAQFNQMASGGKTLRQRDTRFRAGGSSRGHGCVGTLEKRLPGRAVVLGQRALKNRDAVGEIPIVRLNDDAAGLGNKMIGTIAF